ncbi:Ferric iron ABC transporter, permease protein [Paramixta manurensis]|uniref:Ferric iron ABC transporter, permease protein n=2 Tax=Paramixta manurensis TaxID=2740817 RepID=A0A6M8U3M7_9GAMM|nr:Ferric iron ABC transporter, permease protein [Erwiniaceae bacterium PD-1]
MKRYALPATTLMLLTLLVALPLLFIFLQALFPALGEGSLRGILSAFPATLQDPRLPTLLFGTLSSGVGVAAMSLLIGVPLGALRAQMPPPAARLWDILFLIPFLTPPYISALSWMLALQENGYLQQLTGLETNNILFSRIGMVLVMTFNIFPVVYFAVSRSMLAGGQRLADVARVHGATPWRAFWHITLPMSLPALVAGALLAFTLAVEEYGVPAAIGSRAGVSVLTVAIEEKLADWPIDLSGASILSLLLMLMALAAFMLQRRLTGQQDVTVITGKPMPQQHVGGGRWRIPLLLIFSAVALITLVLPIASMMITAFLATLSGGLHLSQLTLRHFSALFAWRGEALSALGTSLSLALGAAIITGFLGLLIAWMVAEKKVRGVASIDALALLPAALPGVVIGVGLILLWNRPFWPISPYNSGLILLLSYCCLFLPWPVRYVSSALKQLGATLAPAARVHGASASQALRLIILPLVFPSLLASMMMVFAVASRELVTSLLLAPAGTQTVSIFIWRQFEQGSVGQGMAMACLAMAISLSVMLLALALLTRSTR